MYCLELVNKNIFLAEAMISPDAISAAASFKVSDIYPIGIRFFVFNNVNIVSTHGKVRNDI